MKRRDLRLVGIHTQTVASVVVCQFPQCLLNLLFDFLEGRVLAVTHRSSAYMKLLVLYNKASILSELCKTQHCHCLCLQEAHRAKDQARPKIPGMTLVAERPHNKHGSSVFGRDGLKVNSISVCEEENVELITVELPGVGVHSLYKPPPEPFLVPPLGHRIKPHIVIGDFNSHSTLWGYTTPDSDGEAVEQWADSNRLSLIHNAKLPKSFNSAI